MAKLQWPNGLLLSSLGFFGCGMRWYNDGTWCQWKSRDCRERQGYADATSPSQARKRDGRFATGCSRASGLGWPPVYAQVLPSRTDFRCPTKSCSRQSVGNLTHELVATSSLRGQRQLLGPSRTSPCRATRSNAATCAVDNRNPNSSWAPTNLHT